MQMAGDSVSLRASTNPSEPGARTSNDLDERIVEMCGGDARVAPLVGQVGGIDFGWNLG